MTDELLMGNRGHLPRFQLPLTLLNLLIRHVRSRRRQRVKESCDKRGAIQIGKRQGFLFNFDKFHNDTIQPSVRLCKRVASRW